jgi:gas vesicle protein
MAEEPDRIKDDIETTRSELTRNVDALADRTMPNRVVRRGWDDLKEKVHGMSEKVMGTPRDMAHSAKDTTQSAAGSVQEATARAGEVASDVAGTIRRAPQTLARQAQGNPIAAGVIAFGVGLLAASLVPTTDMEKRAGRQIKDNAGDLIEPMREPLAESAQQLKEGFSESVGDAAQQVKETAKGAAQTTTDQAKSSADVTTARARQAAGNAT